MHQMPAGSRESFGEELASSLTHGFGAILSLAILVLLVTLSSLHGSVWQIIGSAIFGTSLVVLYTASTLYHSFPQPGARRVFSALDHCSIFLLIAGTYTPFLLVTLRGPLGWSLLALIWSLAALGIGLRLVLRTRPTILFVGLYLAMGWAAVLAIKPIVLQVPAGGLAPMVAGGLAYTAGVGFYVWRRLPYNHAIWHLLVLLGSAFHVAAVYYYVLPSAL